VQKALVLLGWRVRWFARGSAVLLFLFIVMTISGLSQLSYRSADSRRLLPPLQTTSNVRGMR
jgi:hypothetical protein